MMRRVLWLLLALLPGLAEAQERCAVRVVDGDTVLTCEGPVRLRTCNAPEPFMVGGPAAARRLRDLVDEADWLELACDPDLACRDIFNRPICDLLVDGEDACHTLVAEGYARPRKWIRACSRVRPTDRRPLFR